MPGIPLYPTAALNDRNERAGTMNPWLLHHRLNNVFASLRAMAARTRDTSTTLDEFWDAFEGRLEALSKFEKMCLDRPDERIDLYDLILETLISNGLREGHEFTLEGVPLLMTRLPAQTFSFALHELTANAIAHGPLATEGGRIDVRYTIRDGLVHFEWKEHGASPPPPGERGFGLELIEDGLAAVLNGTSRVAFEPDGIRCTVEFQLDADITGVPDE